MSNNARVVGTIGMALAACFICGALTTNVEIGLVVGTFALPGSYFILGEL